MFLRNDDAHKSLGALNAWLTENAEDEGQAARAATNALTQSMKDAPDDVLVRLIELASDLTADKFGRFPLGEAARFGRTEALAAMLARGCDPNQESRKAPIHQDGEQGYHPLLLAIERGHEACVALLLDAKAAHSFKTRGGMSPLEFAQAKGHAGIVSLLEAAGAAATDVSTLTLREAVEAGALERVQELAGTATPAELSNGTSRAVDDDRLDIYSALLPHLSEQLLAGATMSACYSGRADFVRAALAAGAFVDGRESNGDPLLRLVANGKADREAEYLETLQVLLDAGVNVNVADSLGITALMKVAQSAFSIEAARLLVAAGADLDAVDSKKYTVLKWAKREYSRTDKAAMVKYIMAARREAKKRAKAQSD